MYTAKPSARTMERIARSNTLFDYTVACVGRTASITCLVRLKASNMHDNAKRIARQAHPACLAYVIQEVERIL